MRIKKVQIILCVGVGLLLVAAPLVRAARSLRMTRQAVASYARLIGAVNAQDLAAVREQCSRRYLREHGIREADGGGVIELPRSIHRNFQAWREDDEVWLCPTDRQGPVYRFVPESGGFRFDGLVGLLRDGRVVGSEAD